MKLAFIALAVVAVAAKADVPAVPKSDSPDGKLYAVMNLDRDPKIHPRWQGDSYPRIEITEKATKKILSTIEYSGSEDDDARPLREHVSLKWRADSKAFAITIDDRFYSRTEVYALNKDSKFVSVKLPDYKAMTGFPLPNSKDLRPRGRSTVEGLDEKGRLIYDIFYSPLPSFTGNDPLVHRVFLQVSPTKMDPEKVESEKGVWDHGDWVPAEKTKPVTPDKSKAEQPAPTDNAEYERGVAAATDDLAKNVITYEIIGMPDAFAQNLKERAKKEYNIDIVFHGCIPGPAVFYDRGYLDTVVGSLMKKHGFDPVQKIAEELRKAKP